MLVPSVFSRDHWYFRQGAERWIKIFGFSIQPSEIIKVSIVLALAKFYHSIKFDNIGRISYLIIPVTIIIIPFILVIIQPDLGTSFNILMLGIIVMFTAGVRIWKFLLGFVVFVVSLPFMWNFIKPYQQKNSFIFGS